MSRQHRQLQQNNAFPVTMIRVADDGVPRPFHILRCMTSSPKCGEELRLSVGTIRRLPINAIMKQAHQRGWHADRRGYCLCPKHTPWAKRGGEPSNMGPDQKRAAYLSIRDRDMALAERDERVAAIPPSPDKEKHMEIVTERRSAAIERAERDPRLTPSAVRIFKALVAAIQTGDFSKGWRKRICEAIDVNEKTMSSTVQRLIRHGYLAPVPGTFKLIVRYQQEEAVPEVIRRIQDEIHIAPSHIQEGAQTPTGVAPTIITEAPRQPTVEDNRRIRCFLDDNYDEAGGLWCGDGSDAKAADTLNVPRAWVATVRAAFYGEDRNEAQESQATRATELMEQAARLKEDALAIAARAEELEQAARAIGIK